MNFGKYALIDNPEYRFEKEPDLYWRFRPATSADEMHMVRFYETNRRKVETTEGETFLGPHWMTVMWEELSLLFAGTNVDEIAENASKEEVYALLQRMPPAMVEELWIGLGEAVVGWGPRAAAPPEDQEDGTKSSEN